MLPFQYIVFYITKKPLYVVVSVFGGDSGIRTHDPLNAIQVL